MQTFSGRLVKKYLNQWTGPKAVRAERVHIVFNAELKLNLMHISYRHRVGRNIFEFQSWFLQCNEMN